MASNRGKPQTDVYIRDNFFHGQEFVPDDDPNTRTLQWVDGALPAGSVSLDHLENSTLLGTEHR